jgi:hypothetical protein
MDYNRHYQRLVENARERALAFKTPGTERHHIVPQSLGGSDSAENLVQLTCREHYVAHLLLTKIYTGQDRYKMVCALWWMSAKSSNRKRLTSREYARAKEMFAEVKRGKTLSSEHKAKIGKANSGVSNPMFGQTHSAEACTKISDSHKGSRNYMFGKKHSPETLAKISAARKARCNPQ